MPQGILNCDKLDPSKRYPKSSNFRLPWLIGLHGISFGHDRIPATPIDLHI
jgi:hypothetical protein